VPCIARSWHVHAPSSGTHSTGRSGLASAMQWQPSASSTQICAVATRWSAAAVRSAGVKPPVTCAAAFRCEHTESSAQVGASRGAEQGGRRGRGALRMLVSGAMHTPLTQPTPTSTHR
jgi:hypothetical protein